MKTYIPIYRNLISLLLLAPMILLLSGCEDFLEPDSSVEQILNAEVFENEATATAAVTSMYAKLRDEALLTGKPNGLSFLMGIYTDELDYYGIPSDALGGFYQHQVLPTNDQIEALWNQVYQVIYLSNAIMEGLNASEQLGGEIKAQLKGEALFVRGLCHFYLIELFGKIPYIQTTDYTLNREVSRMEVDEAYLHLLDDLTRAREMLETANGTTANTRPDQWTVTALLARVYLYLEEWEQAAQESSLLLTQAPHLLENNLSKVFLKDSPETLWQLQPKNPGANTLEASTFYIAAGPPQLADLPPTFVQAMEVGDLRRQHWVGEVSDGNNTWYFPYKYKAHQSTGTSVEFSVVFRLAEQYLIRAEARAQLGNITGAQEDLNTIRQRAGLPNTTATDQATLLDALLKERKAELFIELGHRWFDLKRMDKAEEVLSPLKPGWKNTNRLLPIPQNELLMNPNLLPQNPGY